MLVAIGGGHVVFAHAGRDSLIDRVQARTGEQSRPHQSVVASIAEAFEGRGISPRRVGIRAFFGVDHRAFGHPLHEDHDGSEENRLIVEHIARQWPAWSDRIVTVEDNVAYLSLRCLIQAETVRLGFRSFGYEKVLPISGAYGHTRHPDPALKQARNLIIVHRTS